MLRSGAHGLSIDAHFVMLRIDACALGGDDKAVDLHAACGNQLFGMAAGCNARVRQEAGQPFTSLLRHGSFSLSYTARSAFRGRFLDRCGAALAADRPRAVLPPGG